MILKKAGDFRGLMRRKIIENHVNVLLGLAEPNHLMQKIHELIAGVAHCRFAVDLAAMHIESGVERQRAVTIIFEAVALGSSR